MRRAPRSTTPLPPSGLYENLGAKGVVKTKPSGDLVKSFFCFFLGCEDRKGCVLYDVSQHVWPQLIMHPTACNNWVWEASEERSSEHNGDTPRIQNLSLLHDLSVFTGSWIQDPGWVFSTVTCSQFHRYLSLWSPDTWHYASKLAVYKQVTVS